MAIVVMLMLIIACGAANWMILVLVGEVRHLRATLEAAQAERGHLMRQLDRAEREADAAWADPHHHCRRQEGA